MMKNKPTAKEKALAQALQEAKPLHPEPDYHESVERAFAEAIRRIEEENGKKVEKAASKRRAIRRGMIAAAIMIVLLIGSTIIAVISPPPNAKAESWFDNLIINLRNAFRIETSITERGIVEENNTLEKQYVSVEEALQDGFAHYLPSYLPLGFIIREIKVLESENTIHIDIFMDGKDANLTISYVKGPNEVNEIQYSDNDHVEEYSWNGFFGKTIQYENGYSVLTCVSVNKEEQVFCYGDISLDEMVKVCQGLTKAE